jgi:EmrB/QacA subfamily drug resistance transporter
MGVTASQPREGATDVTAHDDRATDRSRWLALVVLCAGALMIVLDATVVNVALPSIQSDLGFSQAGLAWVVNAYLIAFGGLLLLAGRLGDLIGRKRMFLSGLGLFTVASLLCGVAQSQEMLIVARFIQGVGGAMGSAVILGMIVTMFPEPREQAKAIGIYSFVASAGASIGLLAGGALTQAINWHWIFFVNIPIGIAAAVLAVRLVAADRGIGLGEGADISGAALVTGALMLGVYTIVETIDYGWGSLHTLGLGAASIVLLAAFVVRQARAATPLMPLRLFRSRNVSGANVVQLLMVAGMYGMFFSGVLFMQRVLSWDAIETGLAFLPVSLGIGVVSLFVAPRLSMRFGGRAVLLPGLALIAAGLLLMTRVPVDANYWVDLLASMALFGVGAGLLLSQLGNVIMSSVEPAQTNEAGGLQGTAQNLGASLGTALIGAVLIAALSTSFVSQVEENPALPSAARTRVEQLAQQGIPIVTVDQVEQAASDAGLSSSQASALAGDYGEAQLHGLRRAIGAVALLALLSLWFTRRLPGAARRASP